MKHAQKKELHKLSVADLESRTAELHKDLQSFRLQKSTGQLGQSHLLGTSRRDLARVKTLLRKAQITKDTQA